MQTAILLLLRLRLRLLLFLALASSSGGQRYSNITRGTVLTAGGSSSSWLSLARQSAFGFFPADSNGTSFLLAVWFNAISPPSVVWYANRRSPTLPRGATVRLTADGRLSLRRENGTETWNPGDTNAVAASVLDTGNLVLADATGAVLWQSFDHPTDTLLPGQVLPVSASLRSQLTDADFSEGRFSLSQDDGNLVLRPLGLPTGTQYDAYWSTNTSGAGNTSAAGNELVYNADGSIYYRQGNGSTAAIIHVLNYPQENFYQRARLDPDGVFRQYVYPKNNSAAGGLFRSTWNVIARVPEDICSALVLNNFGSGVCGYNSYCSSDDRQNPINCMCPPNYIFIDQDYKYKGCKQNFTQTCDLYDPSSFTMITVEDLDYWYFDYEYYDNVDQGQCEDICLEDCFCALAIYWHGEDDWPRQCFKKKLPLTHGHSGRIVDRLALIKVPKNNSSVSAPFERIFERQRPMWVAGRFLLGSSGFLNLILIGSLIAVLVCHRRKRAHYVGKQRSLEELNLRAFSYKELEQATREFKEELGRGAFGVVYKGNFRRRAGVQSSSP